MEIVKFRFDAKHIKKFIDFEYEHYSEDSNYIPPFKNQLRKQLMPDYPFFMKDGNSHCNFIAYDQKQVIGRVTAFINNDLKDNENQPVGTIGFFECIDDYESAKLLLDSALNWIDETKKVKKVWGPMNFDIWHNFRFMTKGFDQKVFLKEPYNKTYYPDFFTKYQFDVVQNWDTIEIADPDFLRKLILKGKGQYDKLLEMGYKFEQFNLKEFDSDMTKLYQIIHSTFNKFIGFTNIPLNEFKSLYSILKYAIIPELSLFIYDHEGVLAGFAAAYPEMSNVVREMKGRETLLNKIRFMQKRKETKTIMFHLGGATPLEISRKSGLGRTGIYYIINNMLNLGYEKVLFSLQPRYGFSQGTLGGRASNAQREYSLYEIKL